MSSRIIASAAVMLLLIAVFMPSIYAYASGASSQPYEMRTVSYQSNGYACTRDDFMQGGEVVRMGKPTCFKADD
jgi:hypothetical protein